MENDNDILKKPTTLFTVMLFGFFFVNFFCLLFLVQLCNTYGFETIANINIPYQICVLFPLLVAYFVFAYFSIVSALQLKPYAIGCLKVSTVVCLVLMLVLATHNYPVRMTIYNMFIISNIAFLLFLNFSKEVKSCFPVRKFSPWGWMIVPFLVAIMMLGRVGTFKQVLLIENSSPVNIERSTGCLSSNLFCDGICVYNIADSQQIRDFELIDSMDARRFTLDNGWTVTSNANYFPPFKYTERACFNLYTYQTFCSDTVISQYTKYLKESHYMDTILLNGILCSSVYLSDLSKYYISVYTLFSKDYVKSVSLCRIDTIAYSKDSFPIRFLANVRFDAKEALAEYGCIGKEND